MKTSVEKEVEHLIDKFGLKCSVEKFRTNAPWYKISTFQFLSEDFIKEFEEKVDWDHISRCQKLSIQFIINHREEMNFDRLFYNDVIKHKLFQELFKYFVFSCDKEKI
jgi:hypothetical protein